MLIDQRPEDIAQLFRHHVDQLLLGNLLNGLIFLGNLRVEIFHRRRQIPGQHFRCIVIHRQQGDTFGIHLPVEFAVFNRGQRVRDHGNLQTVLRHIFSAHVAHQRPAVDEFQAGEVGKEMTLTHRLPYVFTATDFIVRGGEGRCKFADVAGRVSAALPGEKSALLMVPGEEAPEAADGHLEIVFARQGDDTHVIRPRPVKRRPLNQ